MTDDLKESFVENMRRQKYEDIRWISMLKGVREASSTRSWDISRLLPAAFKIVVLTVAMIRMMTMDRMVIMMD